MPKVQQTPPVAHLSDPNERRWTDRDVAVLIELADASGWHRHRVGLPENADGLDFPARCRRRLAWLRTRPPGDGGLWVGLDDGDQVDLPDLRYLPEHLRHLRRPRGGAA